MLTANDIRRKFIKFFKDNSHEAVRSSSLIPKDDPTLLFTNAGMVQFKSIFQGLETRPYTRAVTAQKCLRVGGKHNDLENVGRTARHHTFFEMMGNFSFGDYFKKDAIRLAWDFVTKELELDKSRLWVTVFEEDDEAAKLWEDIAGVAPERILRIGEKDNFWSMGDTGPCGPCSEIFVDQGADMACGPNCGIGTCDCDRFLEIWNLVFMQFNQIEPGKREKLPKPSIDTGMGLERTAAICQGKRSNFDCDLFQDLIAYIADLAGVQYSFSDPDTNDTDTALRVIADHSRAIAFMVADGIMPSNEGRGYVLRRLIRRAYRFGRLIGMRGAFLCKTAVKVVDIMGTDYPELVESKDFIARLVREEEDRFDKTLDKGLALLEQELATLAAGGGLSGDVAFRLYDTYGFPLDIINDVAEKRGFTVDEAGFNAAMKEQKQRAKAAWKGSGEADIAGRFVSLLEEGLHAEFSGYASLKDASRITALVGADGERVDTLAAGAKGYVVTGRTPFYGASGGQAGDTGEIATPTGKATVTDTLKPLPALTVMAVTVTSGSLHLDSEASLAVTEGERMASARNHTATHLLHAALREVLGSHVHQAGSLVAPDRLRFDFTHMAAMSGEELAAVEDKVNAAIMADISLEAAEMSYDEAIGKGAMALFGEKYGDVVRVVCVPGESTELCGGTHLDRTGQAGLFTIISESGIAAGTRRIEAATGWNALAISRAQRAELQTVGTVLKARPGEIADKVAALQNDIRAMKKDLEKAASRAASGQGKNLMDSVETINGMKVLAARSGAPTIKALRETMDDVRSKMPSGIACLTAEEDGKVSLIIAVSKDLQDKFTAPALIKQVAGKIGGSGGGRPDMAQAGGNAPSGIDAAFAELRTILQG
ncbi:alanyl-tRNA synthetase [uncultured delta proteobacterium]|uniref:Alanine--tRNA ligase n=1 Tax=uncultured delta proteobacterium TaxID=34034 RepID=A0A212KBY6_9DELT|nr:alanyl-tRNA synthetase [uncultured delta proteobacterium]